MDTVRSATTLNTTSPWDVTTRGLKQGLSLSEMSLDTLLREPDVLTYAVSLLTLAVSTLLFFVRRSVVLLLTNTFMVVACHLHLVYEVPPEYRFNSTLDKVGTLLLTSLAACLLGLLHLFSRQEEEPQFVTLRSTVMSVMTSLYHFILLQVAESLLLEPLAVFPVMHATAYSLCLTLEVILIRDILRDSLNFSLPEDRPHLPQTVTAFAVASCWIRLCLLWYRSGIGTLLLNKELLFGTSDVNGE